jgi:hypothetical protein
MLSEFRSEVDVDTDEVAEIRRRLDELEQRLEALEGGALTSTAQAELSRLSETERRCQPPVPRQVSVQLQHTLRRASSPRLRARRRRRFLRKA